MIDPVNFITPLRKRVNLRKSREIMERLKAIVREANIAILIPRQIKPPARVEYAPNVDMVISLFKPSDEDTQIQMHVLKQRKPKAPSSEEVTFLFNDPHCCDKAVLWIKTLPVFGDDDYTGVSITHCPFCGKKLL